MEIPVRGMNFILSCPVKSRFYTISTPGMSKKTMSYKNTDINDILIKASSLNDFYSTNIVCSYPLLLVSIE